MDRRELAARILPLAIEGVKAFARAMVAMLAFTLATAVASYVVAGRQWYPVVWTLLLCGAAGAFVAVKHGILAVVQSAVEKAQLGSRTVAMLFAKIPGSVANTAERVPLAQAENMVRAAVTGLLSERAEKGGFSGWLAQRAQSRAIELVKRVTLAEFRAADATSGGIDMVMLQAHLTATADRTLRARIDAMRKTVTVIALVLSSGLSLALAYLARGGPWG